MRLQSCSPWDPPLLNPGHLSDPAGEDLATLRSVLLLLLALTFCRIKKVQGIWHIDRTCFLHGDGLSCLLDILMMESLLRLVKLV